MVERILEEKTPDANLGELHRMKVAKTCANFKIVAKFHRIFGKIRE